MKILIIIITTLVTLVVLVWLGLKIQPASLTPYEGQGSNLWSFRAPKTCLFPLTVFTGHCLETQSQ